MNEIVEAVVKAPDAVVELRLAEGREVLKVNVNVAEAKLPFPAASITAPASTCAEHAPSPCGVSVKE